MSASMDPGTLDRRIKFRKATVTQAGDGQPGMDWSTAPFTVRWAKKVPAPPSVRADEQFRGEQWVGKAYVGFRIRYDATLYAQLSVRDTCRLEDDHGLLYDITYVQEPSGTRHEWIEIFGYARDDTPMSTT